MTDLIKIDNNQDVTLKASEDTLNGLHQIIAKYFIKEISSKEEIDPKLIDQILRFLKDNDVKADRKYSKTLQKLKKFSDNPVTEINDLPFDVEDEEEDEDN